MTVSGVLTISQPTWQEICYEYICMNLMVAA